MEKLFFNMRMKHKMRFILCVKWTVNGNGLKNNQFPLSMVRLRLFDNLR